MKKTLLASAVLMSLLHTTSAMAEESDGGGEFTAYRYEFPPAGQAGPANRICFKLKLLDAEVTELPDLNFKVNPGLPQVDPVSGGGVHWMMPSSPRFGPPPGGPLDDQGIIQVDNPTSHPITAWAIGVPQSSVESPILGYVQSEYGGTPDGWQSATLTRHQWNNNAWTAPNTNDPVGDPLLEVLPAPGPGDWSPSDTSVPGLQFESLFDSMPGLETVILFWTVDIANAIQPGQTMSGFLLGNTGHFLSGQALPFADFGVDGLLATGNLTLVPEPSMLSLIGLGTMGLALSGRRRRMQA